MRYCHRLRQSYDRLLWPDAMLCCAVFLFVQGEYRRAHEVKVSTDALYESELAATHQAWELVVKLKQNKLNGKQQGE
jgi:hypothetical protein